MAGLGAHLIDSSSAFAAFLNSLTSEKHATSSFLKKLWHVSAPFWIKLQQGSLEGLACGSFVSNKAKSAVFLHVMCFYTIREVSEQEPH